MKREIKFRAWMRGSMYYNHSISLQVDGTIHHLDTDGNWEEDYNSNVVELMQYTGLKDKNGVEIYEGDIVECFIDDELVGSNEVIEFKNGSFWLDRRHTTIHEWNTMPDNTYATDLQAIGNIHEHPHLLNQN